ncbi:MAG TPA: AAA family ATPase [Roseiflexaceae bacterium]|nr:AAA family ATPase [Roseiflexaceae bacterium]
MDSTIHDSNVCEILHKAGTRIIEAGKITLVELVRVFRVHMAPNASSILRVMTLPLDKPITCPILIGRTRELAALAALIDSPMQAVGRTALIRGESGIGKSRLATQAKNAALAHSFLVLQAECFQADTSYPYAPLLDLVRIFFAARVPALLASAQERLVREVVRLLPDLALMFPDLAPIPSPLPLDPQQHKRRLFAVLTQLLSNQAAQQPVLLSVEDVHWCDESSLELLLYLVRHCVRQPLVFLFTYRSEEISPLLSHWLAQLDRERLAFELALTPLSRSEVAAMLQAIFAAPDRTPAALVDTIYTLTEGNPFFVEELLRSLITSGELRYVDGTWKFSSDQRDPSGFAFVPRSVQDAVRQRVDRLSVAAKQALTVAAVAGRRFDVSVLQQALHCDEAQLLALMKELIAAQLVVEESADQLAFRHALIHQAISSTLLARERRALHRTIAEAIEAHYAVPSQREAHLADLAYHCHAAGAWTQALEYQQRAGERALALYAPGAAVKHLTHALEAAEHLQVIPPGALYYARGQAYATRGDFDRARTDYEQALDAAREAADSSIEWRSMMALGFLWAERDYAQAGAWFRRALDLAARLADPTLRARSLNRLGNWLSNTGRSEEGLHAHQEALGLFEQQHDTQGMAETFDLLGTTYGMRGDRVKAVELLGQAIALFRSLGDTQSLISSLGMRALQSMPGANETTVCPLRTRDACVQDATDALRLARESDSLVGEVFAENALAHTLLAFGEFGPALAHAYEGQGIATAIEHQQWRAAISYCLGQAYVQLLAPAPAISALEAGLVLAHELGSSFWVATLAATLARAYLLNHDLAAAQAALQAVMPAEQHPRNIAERALALAWGEVLLAQGAPGVALQIAEHLLASAPGAAPNQPVQPIPHLLKLKGEALLSLAQPNAAAAALADARHGAMERNARSLLWTIHRSLGQAYRLLGRDEQASQALAAARQLIAELAATIDEALLREQFERTALASIPMEKPLRPSEAAKRAFGGLTAREREVAALIARGKTSREIAELLVVSERTAEVHVSNILGKLGFTSRAQIAVWAVEKGVAGSAEC